MRTPGLILLLVLYGSIGKVAAQQATEEKPTLPEIAPREVEIRGELIISFPSLERQPLIGFNPPPRIYQIPPDRKPIILPYKQEVASLPPLKLRKPPELAPTIAPVHPAYGLLELKGGTYLERAATLALDYPLSSSLRFLLEARYRGSNGHRPFSTNPDSLYRTVRAPFNLFNGETGLEFSERTLSGQWTLQNYARFHPIWGALPNAEGRQPERSFYQLGTAFNLRFHPSSWIRAHSILAYYTGDTELSFPAPSTSLTDVFQHARGELTLNAGHTMELNGSLHVFTQRQEQDMKTMLRTYSAGMHVNIRSGIQIGATLLGFSARQPDKSSQMLMYLSPSFLIRKQVASWTITLTNTPHVEAFDLAELMRVNPYLHLGSTARTAPYRESIIFPWNTHLQLQLQAGYLRISPEIGYRYTPNWRIWQQADTPGFFTFTYAPAHQYTAGATLIWVTATRRQLTLSAHYHINKLTEQEDSRSIPYEPGFELKGNVYLPLFKNRLIYRAELRILANRFADAAATRPLKNIGELSSTILYHISRNAGVSFAAEHISITAREYWKGYPEARNLLKLGAFLNW